MVLHNQKAIYMSETDLQGNQLPLSFPRVNISLYTTIAMVVVCNECGKQFHNKSNLNRHVKVAHADSKESEDETDEEMDEAPEALDGGNDEVSSDDDEPQFNVWTTILDEARDSNISVLESFKQNVMFCRSLRRDETYQAVLKTLEKAKDDEEMDFSEALDYAVDKRKFLIYKSADETEQVTQEEEQANGHTTGHM